MTPDATLPRTEAPLCVADDARFWPWQSSPALRAWPDKDATVVIVPLAGMADWGLGHPLDAEETVLMPLLRDACRADPNRGGTLVLPPLRFTFGADPGCAFAVDAPTAHALIAEVAASISAAGFTRIVLLNASPWGEELCAAAARDLRVSRGLHLILIHLSALGLDFHPVRSRSRRVLQTVLTSLYGQEPENPEGAGPERPFDWADESVRPLAGAAATLTQARAEGPGVLAQAAGRLASLVSEVRGLPPRAALLPPP